MTISGGGGSGASAIAQLLTFTKGALYVQVTNGGSGYSSAPTVTIAGDGTGAEATATVSGGAVTAINITAAGTGYSYVTITFSGGAGSNAAATAMVSPKGATTDASPSSSSTKIRGTSATPSPLTAACITAEY